MTNFNWAYCQENSDFILASGLHILTESSKNTFSDSFLEKQGNYLISDNRNEWNYIGESKIVSKRLKQHSQKKTSTFYKNYLKAVDGSNDDTALIPINDFQVKTIKTTIGRKEMEEVGMVHISPILNKFQQGKRNLYEGEVNINSWNTVQAHFQTLLEEGENELSKASTTNWFDANINPTAGVYWIEHEEKGLIYIGESSNVLDRYTTHSKNTYFSALRRNLGEGILDFKLQTIKGKKRYFSENEDLKITAFLKECTIKSLEVNFGRFELEEFLIAKHKPLLNKK